MTTEERIKNWKLHPSMRGQFSFELYKAMAKDKNVILLVGDLGWGIFDDHFKDFPDRCINTGAAEQSMIGIACGLSLENKIPFVYSITTFLLYRPFEQLRTYVNHEKLNVKLIGSGRDRDYKHDGISHWSEDAEDVLKALPNIHQSWPREKEDIPSILNIMIEDKKPWFLSLRR